MNTDCWGNWAFHQLQTVPVHHLWRVDEHLYVVIDNIVQRLTSPAYEWPLCSSHSLMKCMWSQQDTLHSEHCLYISVYLHFRTLIMLTIIVAHMTMQHMHRVRKNNSLRKPTFLENDKAYFAVSCVNFTKTLRQKNYGYAKCKLPFFCNWKRENRYCFTNCINITC